MGGLPLTMYISKIIRPANSLVFFSDESGGQVPQWKRGPLILSTSSCVSVGCYPEQDGPTEVILGPHRDVDPGHDSAFDGELNTPTYSVVVWTVDRDRIARLKVLEERTHVRIWVNHPRCPDKITIGVGR